MAKYTELFSEYLENGGALPSLFSEIEGFEELFRLHFADKEIGFETEPLFALKLEEKARLYIPVYKERISLYQEALTKAHNPARVYYEKYNTTINVGKQTSSSKELPFDSYDGVSDKTKPSSIGVAEAYTNTDERETNRTETSITDLEAIELLNRVNASVEPLILKLLNEFNSCFIGVY